MKVTLAALGAALLGAVGLALAQAPAAPSVLFRDVAREALKLVGADPVAENDSTGEFIYGVAEVYRYTRDIGFLTEMWPRIVRGVELDGERVLVTITPTFAGCPAMHAMREEIVERLQALGAGQVEVRTQVSPPWTSEWIAPEARERIFIRACIGERCAKKHEAYGE